MGCGCRKAKQIRAQADAAGRLMTRGEAMQALAVDLGVTLPQLRQILAEQEQKHRPSG